MAKAINTEAKSRAENKGVFVLPVCEFFKVLGR